MIKNAPLALCSLLFCCMPYIKAPEIVERPPAPVKTEWEKYGAYYEIDDLSVETSYLWTPFFKGPQTRYFVNKRLRILTNEGTRHASVEIPIPANLTKFRITMRDASGRFVHLDTARLRPEYLESGVIVFTKVTAGCVLDINLEFSEMRPLTSFEFAFFEDIPVLSSTFTFSYLSDKYRYAYKSYGDPSSHAEDVPMAAMGNFLRQVWTKKEFFPPPRIAYMKSIFETVSRVSVVMKGYVTGQVFGGEQELFGSWPALSSKYNDVLFKTAVFKSTVKLRKKVRELTDGINEDFAKADAVLKWVQDNISLKTTGSQAINPDRVLENGEGDMWDITFLLKEMYGELDCFSDIIVTRPRFKGGFDPAFITPVVLTVSLVVAKIGNKNYIAFPYLRGTKLGEYPAAYFNLQGLSLHSGTVKALPPPFSDKWSCTFTYTLGFPPDGVSQTLNATFSDYWAFDLRTDLISKKKDRITEYFQKMVTSLGISNALTSCNVKNLDDRGSPLGVEIGFENPGQFIERKKERLFKLDHLFGSFFSFYDTSRTSRFTTEMEENIREEIVILKDKTMPVTFHMKCDSIDNALFTISGEERDGDREYRFIRDLHIKKTDLSAEEMRRLYPDILKMQEINESYITIKSGKGG